MRALHFRLSFPRGGSCHFVKLNFTLEFLFSFFIVFFFLSFDIIYDLYSWRWQFSSGYVFDLSRKTNLVELVLLAQLERWVHQNDPWEGEVVELSGTWKISFVHGIYTFRWEQLQLRVICNRYVGPSPIALIWNAGW